MNQMNHLANKCPFHRAAAIVRAHAAAIFVLGGERKCRQPKSVEFHRIDKQTDEWGATAKSLFRLHEGQCYRFSLGMESYNVNIALECLLRCDPETRNAIDVSE